MVFEDYTKVADPLILPINGKKYRIPEVGLADGVKFNLDIEAEAAAREKDPKSVPNPMTDGDFLRLFLGTVYDEMVADNVPGGSVLRAAITAMTDFQKGRAMAEIMWATGDDPKAVEKYLQPNRAARRSTSTGAAKKTPPPDFTSGMTTDPSK